MSCRAKSIRRHGSCCKAAQMISCGFLRSSLVQPPGISFFWIQKPRRVNASSRPLIIWFLSGKNFFLYMLKSFIELNFAIKMGMVSAIETSVFHLDVPLNKIPPHPNVGELILISISVTNQYFFCQPSSNEIPLIWRSFLWNQRSMTSGPRMPLQKNLGSLVGLKRTDSHLERNFQQPFNRWHPGN